MKKIYFLLSLFLLCGLSAACGKKESSTGYYEILSERQDFYDVAADMKNIRSNFLGMQFYQGEAVQLWAVADPNDREKSNIYLYKADGERERIMKGLTGDFLSSCDGFLDREGNLYCFLRSIGEFVVIKTGSDSSRIYRHVLLQQFVQFFFQVVNQSTGEPKGICILLYPVIKWKIR